MGNLAGEPLAPAIEPVPPVTITVQATVGSAGRVKLRIRSGPTLAPDQSAGRIGGSSRRGRERERPLGRFLQVQLTLATDNPLDSPRLDWVRITALPRQASDWHRGVRVVQHQNQRIIRSPIPFEYEPFDHPRLRTLRTEHRLNDVVAGAKDEMELVGRLAAWSATRWERGISPKPTRPGMPLRF